MIELGHFSDAEKFLQFGRTFVQHTLKQTARRLLKPFLRKSQSKRWHGLNFPPFSRTVEKKSWRKLLLANLEKAASAFSETQTECSSLGQIEANFARKMCFSYNINDEEVIKHSPRTSKAQIKRLALETMALISILKAIHVMKWFKGNFINRKFTLKHDSHLSNHEIVCWLPNKSIKTQ